MTTLKQELAALEAAIDSAEMYSNPVPLYAQRKILEAEIALQERVAAALWLHEAERAAPNVARMRTAEAFADEAEQVRDRWLGLAAAAIAEMDDLPDAPSTEVEDEEHEELVVDTGFGLVETPTIEAYYLRQIEWSRETFGPAPRTKGIIDHITKELREIEDLPNDLSEWIEVVILAMDGFWRHGGTARDLMPALLAKQRKNMARTWPDWRTMGEDKAIEHDRQGELTFKSTRVRPHMGQIMAECDCDTPNACKELGRCLASNP